MKKKTIDGQVQPVVILKACPFCGTQAKGTTLEGDMYFVQCAAPSCLAQGPGYTLEENARRYWNRRKVGPCHNVDKFYKT
jgi:hypothetical protein